MLRVRSIEARRQERPSKGRAGTILRLVLFDLAVRSAPGSAKAQHERAKSLTLWVLHAAHSHPATLE